VAFLSKTASAAVTSNSSGGGYLTPSKLTDGGSVRFALLSDEPLEFYECWGTAPDGSQKPFRFDYEPTPEDISTELGNYTPREGRKPGTADVKFAVAVPVFNYETGSVQILSVTQKSILRELDAISQEEDYADLMAWDFTLSKKGTFLTTEYKLRPAPRKKGTQERIDDAWDDARLDIDMSRLITGGNPFKAG
jgi:hypothetical protein